MSEHQTITKCDVELMIRDWQSECADHPAMHNQANVLLSRLKDIRPTQHHRAASKIRLEIQSFQTGDDALFADGYREALAFALDALEPANTTFSSDDDALQFLKNYGHEESQNGVIRGDWRSFDEDCRSAVQYLCDEWDFVFEQAASIPHQVTTAQREKQMNESKFKVGEKVEWTSSNVKKIGEVIAVVPSGKTPVELGYRKAGGGGLPRGHETYVIEGNRVNELGVKYGYRSLFWPVVSLLFHHEEAPSRNTMATHRHKKRGTQYVLIGVGKMQAENWRELIGEQHLVEGEEVGAAVDMREVAIYRSVDDLSLWVRPIEEFNDGRFEPI